MRLGIFGGSFDPPHAGHLLAADDAFAQLGLTRLVFVPAGAQPLKALGAGAAPAHRLAMVHAMVEGDTRFAVSALEVERDGLSFTVDTLRDFEKQFPNAELFFLMGADVLSTFPQWRAPADVVRLAQPVVLTREQGADVPAMLEGVPVRCLVTRRVDVSSTEIRDRVRRGAPVRGFVTDAVAAIIAREGLYR